MNKSTLLEQVINELEPTFEAKQMNLDLDDSMNFWDFVRKARWTDDHDYERIGKILKAMPEAKAEQFEKEYRVKLNQLEKAIDAVTGVSDDSFWDLRAHIIGMGKKAFDKAMGPGGVKFAQGIIDKDKYKENFGYAFQALDESITEAEKDRGQWEEALRKYSSKFSFLSKKDGSLEVVVRDHGYDNMGKTAAKFDGGFDEIIERAIKSTGAKVPPRGNP